MKITNIMWFNNAGDGQRGSQIGLSKILIIHCSYETVDQNVTFFLLR